MGRGVRGSAEDRRAEGLLSRQTPDRPRRLDDRNQPRPKGARARTGGEESKMDSIAAYEIWCDGKPYGVLHLPEWFYRYSYWFVFPDAYLKYLPATWKWFTVYDIPL